LVEPKRGDIQLDGESILSMKPESLRRRVGMVFQHFNLFPDHTALENVMLSLTKIKKMPKSEARRIAETRLAEVGLAGRKDHRPAGLSGGQQQRVAIARALVTRPAVIFADEPTGALDTRTARDVLTLLGNSVRATGQTIVMVTHDPVAASHADSVVFLADGQLAGELHNPTPESVAERMTQLGNFVAARRNNVAVGSN
jgi:ABC-type polar amino acid transport system ATPase subunit